MEEEAWTMVASGSSMLTRGREAGAWHGEMDDVMAVADAVVYSIR